jgi:hypothetical protein
MIAHQLVAITLMALSCAPSYAGNGASIAEVVQSGLRWETRWYGHIFGQRCLQRALQRGGTVRSLVKPVERTIGFSCSSGDAKRQIVQALEATVEGAGIFMSGEIAPSTWAEISDGEDNPNCMLADDDLRKRAKELSGGGVSVPMKAPTDGGTESQPSPTLKSFAARSVALWARKENLAEPRSISIGPVASNDPFVVVGIGDRVLLIRSPQASQAASPDFCGVVFSPKRFAGRHAEESFRKDEIARLAGRLAKVGVVISLR